MDAPPLPERRSARLLILDPRGRLLLFRYEDEHAPPFWSTPGGEPVGDETFEDAAARELLEETGQRLPIGEAVMEQFRTFPTARSGTAYWHERYFQVLAPQAFSPTQNGWTDEERDTIRAHRWWTARELHETSEDLKPEWLSKILRTIPAQRSVPGVADGS